jgi:CCR4-NOT transcriptional regulation complex NOT5 subunit
LDGKAFALDRRPVGKGLDGYYPENDALAEPTKKVLAEIDALYDALGDKSVTDMSSLANTLESPIDKFNVVADSVPGMEIYKKEETKKPADAEVADAATPDGAAPGTPADASAPNPTAPNPAAPATPDPAGAAAPGNPDPAGAAAPGTPDAAGAGAPAGGGN